MTTLSPSETFTRSGPGADLYFEWFRAEAPKAAVLIAHGYAEHCGRYREVAHALVGAGFAVLSFDFRGHGRSSGKRGYVAAFNEYDRDLTTAASELSKRAPHLPWALLAHSNGGLVAIDALVRRSVRPACAIFTSPFLALRMEVPRLKKWFGLAVGRLAPALALKNEIDIRTLTHDAAKLAEREKDTLCHEVATPGWFRSAVTTQERLLATTRDLPTPTLWLLAADDQLANTDVSRQFAQRLANAEIEVLPGMFHEVLNEVGRNEVFRQIQAYLGRQMT